MPRAGVIGRPIGHSLSPAIFRAAFGALGLDGWAYEAFEVGEDQAAAFAGRVRDDLVGLSVTMPDKAAVIPALDELAPVAADLGAVNCIARHPEDAARLVGHNTDGPGLVDALRLDEGLDLHGRRAVLLGAGGAGRAVARALGEAGVELAVVNRSADRAEVAARLAGARGRVGTLDDVAGAELIVNATSVGMGDDHRLPLERDLLHGGQVVVDLVYHPLETPLLAAAAAAGAHPVGGVGMLVHQAAHQLRLWTGAEPPVDAMRAGALAALAERAG
jgi:shikimate dehydrogenase